MKRIKWAIEDFIHESKLLDWVEEKTVYSKSEKISHWGIVFWQWRMEL